MLLFIGFFSKAEPICYVSVDPAEKYDAEVYIQESCKKNDILTVVSAADGSVQGMRLVMAAKLYCRFDREIIIRQSGRKQEEQLICVLNDPVARIFRLG